MPGVAWLSALAFRVAGNLACRRPFRPPFRLWPFAPIYRCSGRGADTRVCSAETRLGAAVGHASACPVERGSTWGKVLLPTGVSGPLDGGLKGRLQARLPATLKAIFAFVPAALLAQVYLSTLPLDPSAPLDNPVERLRQQLAAGKMTPNDLPSLLAQLDIHTDTQALVFSKTSFQRTKIGPRNPRAIYFNDEVAVGWVPGGDGMEVAASDPRQGTVFYTFSESPPKLTRREECVHCHHGASTMGVPGMFVGSVFPDSSGAPARMGAIVTDHRTPFADRWGGWYVTAIHGEQRDRANATAPDPAEPLVLATEGRQNLRSLAREFDTTKYLAQTSDIVALMTFEHQTQMANLITRLGWDARMNLPIDADLAATADYMLFEDEAPLREPIQGVSTFTDTFPQRGPRDRKGRSLRDFDLHTRLFRYPLSYMIYSRAFDALPENVKDPLYRRLYASLTAAGRRDIVEILRDTKPSLPSYWRNAVE